MLDFGRTTFGACCTGMAKTCLRLAAEHARTRVQFGHRLGHFELVQKKLARMAAWTYAMQAMTAVTAGLIDRGLEDYMLETAMLKVFSTDALWTIVNDAFQIYGGAGLFHRPAAGTHAPRRPHQPHRRGGQRSAHVVHCPGGHARSGRRAAPGPRFAVSPLATAGRAGTLYRRGVGPSLAMAPRARAVAGVGPARSGRQPLDPPLRPDGRAEL